MHWCSVLFGDTELSLRAPNLLAHGVYREPLTRADADYIHAYEREAIPSRTVETGGSPPTLISIRFSCG
jgi:hypothetical protein